jgi:hypothetical protein
MTEYDGRTTETVLYDAGLSISIKKDVCEIYFPLLLSQGFTDYKNAYGLKYAETIRFTLNLNLLNPFDLIKNFEL